MESLHEIEDAALKSYMAKKNLVRYKARAEHFGDLMTSVIMISKTKYKFIKPNVVGHLTGDCFFDFYSDATAEQLKDLWKTGSDLHVIYQTIKPFEEFTGKGNGK